MLYVQAVKQAGQSAVYKKKNLFAVALGEVDDVGPSRRQVHQRSGARLP